MEFLLFLVVLFIIKAVPPEETLIGVCLVITSAVHALEEVWAWFPFFCFQSWGICFLIYLVALSKMSMVFGFVRTIALDAFCLLDSVQESHMPPFLAVLALGHARVYVCLSDGNNIVFYVETSVNETFHLTSTLNISDVQPDYSHI